MKITGSDNYECMSVCNFTYPMNEDSECKTSCQTKTFMKETSTDSGIYDCHSTCPEGSLYYLTTDKICLVQCPQSNKYV